MRQSGRVASLVFYEHLDDKFCEINFPFLLLALAHAVKLATNRLH
jgi:hypothetical protein